MLCQLLLSYQMLAVLLFTNAEPVGDGSALHRQYMEFATDCSPERLTKIPDKLNLLLYKLEAT